MFSPSFFSHFFPPSLVQFSRHHNQGKDAWIQMSSGRRSLGIKHTSTFWSSVGFNSKIDDFALLIFSGRSAPPDANGGRQNQPTRVWWLRRFRWMSLSSDGRLSPRSVTHVTLSRGLHRWNRIHFHNAKCPCVPYAWLAVFQWSVCTVDVSGGGGGNLMLHKKGKRRIRRGESRGEEKHCWDGNALRVGVVCIDLDSD